LDSFALDPEEAQRRFMSFMREREKDIGLVIKYDFVLIEDRS